MIGDLLDPLATDLVAKRVGDPLDVAEGRRRDILNWGKRSRKSEYTSATRGTCVCCSMISATRIA